MFIEFINEYGATMLYTLITAIAGYLGIVAKSLITKYLNDKTKKDVARTVVKAVEQIYKDIHGDEKIDKALISAAEILSSKGITTTDLELRYLLESAVNEFNNAVVKPETPEDPVPAINDAEKE